MTLCKTDTCPFREMCHRHEAEPSYRQSYFTAPPQKNGHCEYYWFRNERFNVPMIKELAHK